MCSPELAIPNESYQLWCGSKVTVSAHAHLNVLFSRTFSNLRRRYRRNETSKCRQDNGTTVSDSVATVVGSYLLEEQSLIEAFNGLEKVSYLRYECTRKEL